MPADLPWPDAPSINEPAIAPSDKASHIESLVHLLESLTERQCENFVLDADLTAPSRAVAAQALTDVQTRNGWDNVYLEAHVHSAHQALEAMMAAGRPHGMPYVARLAAVDAARAVMCRELLPVAGVRLWSTLTGPVGRAITAATEPGFD